MLASGDIQRTIATPIYRNGSRTNKPGALID